MSQMIDLEERLIEIISLTRDKLKEEKAKRGKKDYSQAEVNELEEDLKFFYQMRKLRKEKLDGNRSSTVGEGFTDSSSHTHG